MPKRAFGEALTKIFNHKRYTYFRSFDTKSQASRQARVLRSEGRLARITNKEMRYFGSDVTRWLVWVK